MVELGSSGTSTEISYVGTRDQRWCDWCPIRAIQFNLIVYHFYWFIGIRDRTRCHAANNIHMDARSARIDSVVCFWKILFEEMFFNEVALHAAAVVDIHLCCFNFVRDQIFHTYSPWSLVHTTDSFVARWYFVTPWWIIQHFQGARRTGSHRCP